MKFFLTKIEERRRIEKRSILEKCVKNSWNFSTKVEDISMTTILFSIEDGCLLKEEKFQKYEFKSSFRTNKLESFRTEILLFCS